jgi:DNA primase
LDLEELKSKINVREFAEECGLEVTPSHKTYCWHGDERTPSLHLYDDGWWCFRCGEGGDIIDLVIQLKHWSWKRSANFLTEYLGESLTLDEPVQKAERPPVPDMRHEFQAGWLAGRGPRRPPQALLAGPLPQGLCLPVPKGS